MSGLKLSDRQRLSVAVPAAPISDSLRAERNSALDYTKGALVLLMVIYHWLNHFHPVQIDLFRYLRFLTPSFIFITGFLISNIYLVKYNIADIRLPRRLMTRGLKILAVFVGLNAGVTLLFPNNGRIYFDATSLDGLVQTFLTGNILLAESGKIAAFPVLVPIGYLLLIGATLVVFSRRYRYSFEVLCVLLFAIVFVLRMNAYQFAYLELLAIGSLGIICGRLPIERINTFIKRPVLLAVLYLLYILAITKWDVIYWLQVAGVCLSLLVLYAIGTREEGSGRRHRVVVILGKYSLFGYIAQIGLLFALAKIATHLERGAAILFGSLLLALALTVISVLALDAMRRRSVVVDRAYKAVFA